MGAKPGHEVTPETRAKLSAALKGRKIAPEVLAKRIGRKQSPEHVRNRIAPLRGANWGGDNVGYTAIHLRMKKILPRECAACGKTEGRLESALLKTAPPENLRIDPDMNIAFSVRPDDYICLCPRCHRRYDKPNPETSDPIVQAIFLRASGSC